MTKVTTLLAVGLCLAVVGMAYAAPPEVTTPKMGDKIGPSVDVAGKTDGKTFVIIITDVYQAGVDAPLRSVPGIRHWTDDQGNFAVRIAAPRVPHGKTADLIYKIRVFTQRPGEEKSEETVITCYPM